MNPLTYFIENQQKSQSEYDLGVKFRPHYIQCCKKSKEMGIINRFLHILHGQYLWQQKVVVAQIPEWKFEANRDRNATSEGC